jgi:hypothetical protein
MDELADVGNCSAAADQPAVLSTALKCMHSIMPVNWLDILPSICKAKRLVVAWRPYAQHQSDEPNRPSSQDVLNLYELRDRCAKVEQACEDTIFGDQTLSDERLTQTILQYLFHKECRQNASLEAARAFAQLNQGDKHEVTAKWKETAEGKRKQSGSGIRGKKKHIIYAESTSGKTYLAANNPDVYIDEDEIFEQWCADHHYDGWAVTRDSDRMSQYRQDTFDDKLNILRSGRVMLMWDSIGAAQLADGDTVVDVVLIGNVDDYINRSRQRSESGEKVLPPDRTDSDLRKSYSETHDLIEHADWNGAEVHTHLINDNIHLTDIQGALSV